MRHVHRRVTDHRLRRTTVGIVVPLAVAGSVLTAPAFAAETAPLTWTTVANAGDLIPGSSDTTFNSFNQPSVNTGGLVVFRARSQGGMSQGPVRGIFTRNAAVSGSAISLVFKTGKDGLVPDPNNTDAKFNEFPSFPRIGMSGSAIATRGQSQPVWKYPLPDGSETRVGTSGVYAQVNGQAVTGASLLGAVPGFEYYAVPGAATGTRFDQFPGAPSIDGTTIAFKGNYTEGLDGKTGVYVRDLSSATNPVRLIANTGTRIPNQPKTGDVAFGSTAPPSAAAGKMVFVGLDNEADPRLGGIYLARTSGDVKLKTLVGIGDRVPGQTPSDRFTQLGESLSFDGRYVAFWGAWGTEMREITLTCPTDGNADLLQACNDAYAGGTTTESVPVHQGVFVYDTQSGQLRTAATTGAQFQDFLYWVYSGRVPGKGDEQTLEPPRWRSSAFMAVSAASGSTYQVAFKASPTAGGSGIYLTAGPGVRPPVAIVDTSTVGTAIDPAAAGTFVTSVGLERDGFRGRWLALAVSMANADATVTWAGVYATQVPSSLGS